MKALRLFLISIIIASTTACAVNPVTGRQELSLIPESQELAIGNEQYGPAQQSQGGRYTVDPEVSDYVSRVGQSVAAVSDRDLPYEFVVINDSTPNAWALPGGKIAINRGLLTELNSEAELAAVLGHEVVHAAARHGAQAMQRGMMLQTVVMASAIGAAVSDSDYGNVIVGGAQLGAQLINQSYSRDAESESDYYGMVYMKRAGYDPAAAVTLQETFVRLSEGRSPGWIEGLFASHPPSQSRVEANRQTLAELGAGGEVGRDDYLAATRRLFDTEPAYAAFDQASGLLQQGHEEDALTFVNRALSIEPEEPRFYGLRGEILMAQGEYARATEEFDKALIRDDAYFEYYLGRGLANARLNRRDRARADLERSNQLLPTAIANQRLGELSLAAGDDQAAKRYFEVAMGGQGEIAAQAQAAYIRLDIKDNVSRYVAAQPYVARGGEVRAQVTNASQLPLGNVVVQVSLTVNGNAVSRTARLDRLDASSSGSVGFGIGIGETDVVTNATASVTAAVPLD